MSVRIAILVEGETEKVFIPHLRKFLAGRLAGRAPILDPVPQKGRIPTKEKLKRVVEGLLRERKGAADHVIALVDVYPDFRSAEEAKAKMREWVGPESCFHPHVALHDFEAWLLPFWDVIKALADHNQTSPGPNPESVNHNNPPSKRIEELFLKGKKGKSYVKPRDAGRILREADLSIAIAQCSELKALVNTIISACNGEVLP